MEIPSYNELLAVRAAVQERWEQNLTERVEIAVQMIVGSEMYGETNAFYCSKEEHLFACSVANTLANAGWRARLITRQRLNGSGFLEEVYGVVVV